LLVERAVGDHVHEAMTLSNIGTINNLTGHPQEALASFQQALTLGREVHDRAGEAITLNNIGQAYLDIGEPMKALASFAQALPIEREVATATARQSLSSIWAARTTRPDSRRRGSSI
jgi:tetratricopeptide (TPR) repeat protein